LYCPIAQTHPASAADATEDGGPAVGAIGDFHPGQ
jgi:hypothetical protein